MEVKEKKEKAGFLAGTILYMTDSVTLQLWSHWSVTFITNQIHWLLRFRLLMSNKAQQVLRKLGKIWSNFQFCLRTPEGTSRGRERPSVRNVQSQETRESMAEGTGSTRSLPNINQECQAEPKLKPRPSLSQSSSQQLSCLSALAHNLQFTQIFLREVVEEVSQVTRWAAFLFFYFFSPFFFLPGVYVLLHFLSGT